MTVSKIFTIRNKTIKCGIACSNQLLNVQFSCLQRDLVNIWYQNYVPFLVEIQLSGHALLTAEDKFCNHLRKFGCQPRKSQADLCMTNISKVLIYLTLISFFSYKSKSFRNNKKDKQVAKHSYGLFCLFFKIKYWEIIVG